MTRASEKDDCLLAARGLRKQLKLLAGHLAGVRQCEENEGVHRVRVASRRLRAVLSMFGACWKGKQVKSWKKCIRQLAVDLGEARDCDVQIDFLTEKLASTSDAALVPGIARLLNHVEQQRQWLQPRVLQAVDRLEKCSVLKEMGAAARRILDAADTETESRDAVASRRAVKCIRKRLKKLLAEAPGLSSPQDMERHHAMRIAAKRLRYSLELARSHPPAELAAMMENVKRLQSLLGEIHDCDVWVENLDAFTRTEVAQLHVFFGESRRINRLLPGIENLRLERQARREQLFCDLVALWQELAAKHLWERMLALLESPAAPIPSSNGTPATAESAPSARRETSSV